MSDDGSSGGLSPRSANGIMRKDAVLRFRRFAEKLR